MELTNETYELLDLVPTVLSEKIKFNKNEPVNIVIIIKALIAVDGFPLSTIERINILTDFSKLSGYSQEELVERSGI